MPFYLRKSVSAGPFRFNFSNSGVGVSVGVRGLRIGTGPRGHYIHAGRNGFYYRASLGRAGERVRRSPSAPPLPRPVEQEVSGVTMVEIESADVLAMQDEEFAEVLREINDKSRQVRLSTALAVISGLAGIGGALVMGPPGLLVGAFALPGYLLGQWLDSYRRTTVLFYNVDDDYQRRVTELTAAFDRLAECSAKWHVQASGAIYDTTIRKRNAGASRLLKRATTGLAYRLPAVIRSNATPPVMQVGKQSLYFFPDVILIENGSRFGAIAYGNLAVRVEPSRFIEEDSVPRDAQIVDHTWRFPNRNGGPDRRFNNNRQLPVCLYDSLYLTSPQGLNEVLQFSRVGLADTFAQTLRAMPPNASSRSAATPPWGEAPRPQAIAEPDEPVTQPASRGRGWLVKTALAAGVIVAVAALWRSPSQVPVAESKGPVVPTSASPAPAPAPEASPPAAPAPPVNAPPQPAAAAPQIDENAPLTPGEVRDLQARLKALGFDPGDIDGIPGPQTAAAIRRFEASRLLTPTGSVDRRTLQRLKEAGPSR